MRPLGQAQMVCDDDECLIIPLTCDDEQCLIIPLTCDDEQCLIIPLTLKRQRWYLNFSMWFMKNLSII
jgi:hypothetical protein